MTKQHTKTTSYILIAIFFIFASVVASATSEQKLNQKLQQFNSLSANFTQKTYASDGSLLQTSKGSLLILRPGKFRWFQSSPIKQLIVTNGKTLWVYDPSLSQVTIKTLGDTLAQTPLLLLSKKDYALNEDFIVKELTNHQYEIISAQKNDAFKKVTLQFADNKISNLQLVSNLNQTTKIQFYNVKLNISISLNQFTFKPPKGVDVISMTNNE